MDNELKMKSFRLFTVSTELLNIKDISFGIGTVKEPMPEEFDLDDMNVFEIREYIDSNSEAMVHGMPEQIQNYLVRRCGLYTPKYFELMNVSRTEDAAKRLIISIIIEEKIYSGNHDSMRFDVFKKWMLELLDNLMALSGPEYTTESINHALEVLNFETKI